MKKKEFFLSLACGVGVLMTTVFALGNVQDGSKLVYSPSKAVALNTIEFGVRKEASYTCASEPSQGEGGWTFDVTNGDFQSWKLGLSNWSFPVEDGKNYYCEFVMTANVSGSEGDEVDGGVDGADYSEVVLVCNEGIAGFERKNWFKRFTADQEFIVGQEFTASGTSSIIHLQLGGLRTLGGDNAFRATVKKFVLKENNAGGNILRRINFESGVAFADRWKADHVDKYYCSGEGAAKVVELIYDYSGLYSGQRAAIADAKDADGTTKIVDSIAYFANRNGIELE